MGEGRGLYDSLRRGYFFLVKHVYFLDFFKLKYLIYYSAWFLAKMGSELNPWPSWEHGILNCPEDYKAIKMSVLHSFSEAPFLI